MHDIHGLIHRTGINFYEFLMMLAIIQKFLK